MFRLIIIFFFLCVSCINLTHHYGPHPDIKKINVGDTKKEVEEKLGKESYSSEIDEETWYYISTEVKKNIINALQDLKIIKIKFDKNDIVTEIYETIQEKEKMPRIKKEITKGTGISAEKSIKDKIKEWFKNLSPSL